VFEADWWLFVSKEGLVGVLGHGAYCWIALVAEKLAGQCGVGRSRTHNSRGRRRLSRSGKEKEK